jgi:hypothetical protein
VIGIYRETEHSHVNTNSTEEQNLLDHFAALLRGSEVEIATSYLAARFYKNIWYDFFFAHNVNVILQKTPLLEHTILFQERHRGCDLGSERSSMALVDSTPCCTSHHEGTLPCVNGRNYRRGTGHRSHRGTTPKQRRGTHS